MEAQTHKGNDKSYYEHNFTRFLQCPYVLMETFSTLSVARQKSSLTHSSNTGFILYMNNQPSKEDILG